MNSRVVRTLAIFRLALSYWRDSRRMARARHVMSEDSARERESAILTEGAIRFRETALKMGGLIIKVGQFLSARTDILPVAFTRELAHLQDQVPPAAWAEVRELMSREWGRPPEEIFDLIEAVPVAAASLGQVHRAVLTDGREVAVKVQRPDIERLAVIDLSALGVVMRLLERTTRVGRRINAHRLFQEFRGLVEHELDYQQESRYLERFRQNFADDAEVVVPAVIDGLTQKRVFVMEYVRGVKVTDLEALRRQGVSPPDVGNRLIRAYLKQIVVDGFVQLDPHPGNFFVDETGRLIFIDFGMMGEIVREDLDGVVQLLQGILAKNADLVVQAIDTLGFVRPNASFRLLRRAITFMLDRLSGVPLRPGPQMDRAVTEFQDFLYQEPLEFPARYMFLGRAIGMLFGLVSGLNPTLDWLELLKKEALPLLKKRQQESQPDWIRALADFAGNVLGEAPAIAVSAGVTAGWRGLTDAAKLPGQLRRVLSVLEAGELATVPENTQELRRLDRLAALARAQLLLLWAGAIGGFMYAAHRIWPQSHWLDWILGVVLLIVLVQALVAGATGGKRGRWR